MPDDKMQPPSSDPTGDQSVTGKSPQHEESWWVEALKTVGLSLVLAFGIRTFVAEARYIPSGSMEPTLQINDRLIVDKMGYRFHLPERGDIVVFNPTDALIKDGFKDAFIKRIVGLPGDDVAIENGKVYINGRPLQENYLPSGVETTIDTCNGQAFLSQTQKVPPQAYLVLGDNRDNSFDGRCWGFVPQKNIIGRASIRFWPIDRAAFIPAGEPGQPVTNP